MQILFLCREFEKDGLGEDFGTFLSSLDTLSDSLVLPKKQNKKEKKKKKSLQLPEMDDETRKEWEMLQVEDAAFLAAVEDLPTDDELEEDEEDWEDSDLEMDDEVARNTEKNKTSVEEDNEESSEEDVEENEEENEKEVDNEVEKKEEEEDIYGRLKVKSTSASLSKYVPPHLRKVEGADRELVRVRFATMNYLFYSEIMYFVRWSMVN